MGGQGQEVTLLPLHEPTVDRREAAAADYVIQLGRGIGVRGDLFSSTDPHKVCNQRRARRGTAGDTQLMRQVQRDDLSRTVGIEAAAEFLDGNLRSMARSDWVRG